MSRFIQVELTDEEVEWMQLNWAPARQDLPVFTARAKIFEALTSTPEPEPVYRVTNFICDRETVTVTLTGPLGEEAVLLWSKGGGGQWCWSYSGGGYVSLAKKPFIETAIAKHDFLSTWFLKDNASYYGRTSDV